MPAPITPIRSIGLTGGIGSGKSSVASMLQALGAVVIDADAISRALTASGGVAIDPIRNAFGDAAIGPDGALDRARMRELVFSEPSARERLESILHPLIGEESRRQAAQAGADAVIVHDVPLLAESAHWRQRVQRILVVDCSEATQAERVAARPGWTAESARLVIAQQASRARRRAIADAVIHNDGISLEALAVEVQSLWALWVGPVRRTT